MKIRVTGKLEQVKLMTDYLQKFGVTKCTYISTPYKQTRKSIYNQNVSVYMDFEDYDFKDR